MVIRANSDDKITKGDVALVSDLVVKFELVGW